MRNRRVVRRLEAFLGIKSRLKMVAEVRWGYNGTVVLAVLYTPWRLREMAAEGAG
jgi:hypothetical protein